MKYLVTGKEERNTMNETGQLSIEKLQQELSLKQLQINSLLTITQAINDNVAAPELYNMYKSFIGWKWASNEGTVFHPEGTWRCVVHLQADALAVRDDPTALTKFFKTQRISKMTQSPGF
jgi:hypothetical protein